MYQVKDIDFEKANDENKSKNFVLNLDLNDLQPWVRNYVRAVGNII